jgi:hypothetical protein
MRGALLSSVMLAAACYQPAIQSGVPCSQSGDCPGGEACVAGVCGGTVTGPDAPDAMIDAQIDAPPGSTVFVAGADKGQLRDTELFADFPNDNYGDQDHFSVDDTEVGLVSFDLSGAPGGRTLVKATLRIVTTDDADEGGGTVRVYRMLESWTEAGATWTMRTAAEAWATPGAGPPSREVAPIATFSPDKVRTSYEVELPVDLVRAWLAQPASNFGLAFVRGTSTQHVHMGTRETAAWSKLTLELRP